MATDGVLYCCSRCRGLFVTPTQLRNHTDDGCDGSVGSARDATMFAVSRDEMVLLEGVQQGLQQDANLEGSGANTVALNGDFDVSAAPSVSVLESDFGAAPEAPNESAETAQVPQPAATPDANVRKSYRLACKRKSLVMVGDKIIFSGGRKRKIKEEKISPKKKPASASKVCNEKGKAVTDIENSSPNEDSNVLKNMKLDVDKHNSTEAATAEDTESTNQQPVVHEESTIKEEVKNDEFIPIKKPKAPKKPPKPKKEPKDRRKSLAKKYQEYVTSSTETMNDPQKPGSRQYQCPHCPWKSTMVGFFDRHLNTKHGETGTFICPYCDTAFTDRPTFNKHVKIHEKTFICETCAERFTTAKDLQRHTWKHTGETPFKCDLCDFSTRFKERLKIHNRVHTGERLHCDVEGCTYTTRHDGALRQHKDGVHRQGKLLQCPQCPYTTPSSGCMHAHERRHMNIKNFECSVCGYRANTKQMVIKHLRIKHTAEKHLKCDRCDYRSAHESAFRLHMMAHMNIKPFQCTGCGYLSVAKQKIIRHIRKKNGCNNAQVLVLDEKPQLDWAKYKVTDANSIAETEDKAPLMFNVDPPAGTGMDGPAEILTVVVPEDESAAQTTQHYLDQGYTIQASELGDITYATDIAVTNDDGTYTLTEAVENVIIIDAPTTDVQEVLIKTETPLQDDFCQAELSNAVAPIIAAAPLDS